MFNPTWLTVVRGASKHYHTSGASCTLDTQHIGKDTEIGVLEGRCFGIVAQVLGVNTVLLGGFERLCSASEQSKYCKIACTGMLQSKPIKIEANMYINNSNWLSCKYKKRQPKFTRWQPFKQFSNIHKQSLHQGLHCSVSSFDHVRHQLMKKQRRIWQQRYHEFLCLYTGCLHSRHKRCAQFGKAWARLEVSLHLIVS